MRQVYFFNIRNGELRRAGGSYIATYAENQPDVALESMLNEGYGFLAMNESHIFLDKTIDD